MSSTQHPNEQQGEFAERVVAREFDLDHAPAEAEWYDCVDPSTGTKYEVKSATETLDNGASGRFRLWGDQHRSLAGAASADGQTAWYVFVLLGEDGDVLEIRRMRPQTVTRVIHDDGGAWNRAGHADRGDDQHKIPWEQVIDR